jgi:DNA-binding HxlR family transcriptional regulator
MKTHTIEHKNRDSLFSQIMNISDSSMIMDETCILHQSVMLLSDKWTLLILLSLMQGPKRTSDLLRQIEGVSPKMLTHTLKKLQDANLVVRKVFPVVPPKVEYSLTKNGWGLQSVLSELYSWSVSRNLK